MIKEVQLENYRCFEKSKIKYKDLVVLVGKNNAGKSSMIEALRMIAFASQKSIQTTYKDAPWGLGVSQREKGIRIDVDKLKIDLRGIVYLYEDKIAKITAIFSNGCRIVILANKDIAFAFLYSPEGKNIKLKAKAEQYNFGNIGILPQIGLIKENEKLLSENTVISNKETYLSSRHFRNEILMYRNEYWENFKRLAEESWEELQIVELNYNLSESENIRLMVSDARFLAEIGLMGSGLQMWLQIIWFICRSEACDTIILDEPDVYMHPDLQKSLLAMVKRRYKQVIIATHSVEIISEVHPENIVMIDKYNRSMKYANNLKAVQNIIDNIGGIQNLSLIRIGAKKKCLFVEGKDIKILSKLYDKLYPDNDNVLVTLPVIELHGFSNLQEAFGASKLFYSETKGEINSICIIDRDYYPDELLQKKRKMAEENHLCLHIWEKKEIENYLIIPKVLYRMIKDNSISYEEFLKELEEIVDEYKDKVTDQLAEHQRENNKNLSMSTCNEKARNIMKEKWNLLDNKLAMLCGKDFIKRINTWLREKYKVSCSIDKIIKEIRPEEINEEMIEVFKLIS